MMMQNQGHASDAAFASDPSPPKNFVFAYAESARDAASTRSMLQFFVAPDDPQASKKKWCGRYRAAVRAKSGDHF
jgi:hypothetical protein